MGRACHGPGWLGKLVTCTWCASGWVSLALVAGIDLWAAASVPAPPVCGWPSGRWGGAWPT